MKLKVNCLVTFLLLGASPPVFAGVVEYLEGKVSYDAAGDRLSVDVRRMALNQLLRQIVEQTGITILADPAMENRLITVKIPGRPLDQALRKIFRGLSYVLRYDNGPPLRVSAVTLLPAGREDNPRLVPIAAVNAPSNRDYRNTGEEGVDTGYAFDGTYVPPAQPPAPARSARPVPLSADGGEVEHAARAPVPPPSRTGTPDPALGYYIPPDTIDGGDGMP